MLIDEAYQLSPPDGTKDFGAEAVEAVMQSIEGDSKVQNRPAYIFAGYPDDMDRFLKLNMGLTRRIDRTFVFPDYDASELAAILFSMASSDKYNVAPTEAKVAMLISGFPEEKRKVMNAGLSRKLLESAKVACNGRLMSILRAKKEPTTGQLMTLTSKDFQHGSESLQKEL
jgi:hypothetical protein